MKRAFTRPECLATSVHRQSYNQEGSTESREQSAMAEDDDNLAFLMSGALFKTKGEGEKGGKSDIFFVRVSYSLPFPFDCEFVR